MTGRPTIGILMDYESSGSFSARPHYAIRIAYFDAVWMAGGLPVALPYLAEALGEMVASCDGVVTPGGRYPFPDAWYGEAAQDGQIEPLFAFETELTQSLLDSDTPILGICAGMQVMAGLMGGHFYRDVRHELETRIDHLDERPAEEKAHSIAIEPGSLLQKITGRTEMEVNTAHREALRNQPAGVTVNARAPDGVVEGIEFPGHRFALGVQWHPEFFAAPGEPDFEIFRALVAAAETRGR